jgi:ubiquinone/menaquinone biosynthesis C-methylase UbiE
MKMADSSYNVIDALKDILCCPICKGNLSFEGNYTCSECYESYDIIELNLIEKSLLTLNTLVKYPRYCLPETYIKWRDVQDNYEKFHKKMLLHDDLDVYLSQIDSVDEIYKKEFMLSGSVLDVGGHQGRLRYFMNNDVNRYVSIEPFAEVFNGLNNQPNLLKAYPFISKPHDFIVGRAERLPFKSNTFDWVHMRSVVDHFLDPYIALKEACRVLKPGGSLLIGVAILEKMAVIGQKGNLSSVVYALLSRLKNVFYGKAANVNTDKDHLFHFTYHELLDLILKAKFVVTKEHWQKPPHDYCLYLSAVVNK